MPSTIRNRGRITQIVAFGSMPVEGTDIDFLSELGDSAYVIVECKAKGAPWPRGQNIALERLTKDLHNAGKDVLTIRAEHTRGALADIDLAECSVLAYLDSPRKWGDEWVTPKDPQTVSELIEDYLDLWGKDLPRAA